MAHIVQIPVSFEFRPAKVEWKKSVFRVTGWAKETEGSIDPWNLAGSIQGSKGRVPAQMSILLLPDDILTELWARPEAEVSPRDLCDGLELEVFIGDGLRARAQKESRFLVVPDSNSLTDAWKMRDELFRVEDSSDSVQLFLEKWGAWSNEAYVFPEEVLATRDHLKQALINGEEHWLAYPDSFPVLDRIGAYPYFAVHTSRCEVAATVTVAADLLSKLRFRRCARRDCRGVFALETKHKRSYCSQYCAHLESVRRNRRLARTSK